MFRNLLIATCSLVFCQVVFAQSGNSLALQEGPSDVDRAYGSDVEVDFPSVYTSGQYTLSWYQNVDPSVDTIHQVVISQGPISTAMSTGLNAVSAPDWHADGNQSGMPSYVAMQWNLNAPGPPFVVPGSTTAELEFGVWAQHVVAIDLDADTFSYDIDGRNLVPAGTRWDNPNSAGPALAGIATWTGLAGPDVDANENGIDGYVQLDDFLLTDGSGNVVWSEDFENGFGSFHDLPGAVPAVICNGLCVPEPPTIILGDVNLDGEVNGLDVDPFVEVLLSGPYQPEADMNEDEVVNGLDVDPFVAAVVGDDAHQTPEPSTLLLCIIALGVVGGWRKWKRPCPDFLASPRRRG
jgi:hypothetical protein